MKRNKIPKHCNRLIQTGILMSSFMLPVSANTYSDVSSGDWFYSVVTNMSQRGYMEGTGNGKFEPNGSLTTAEFAVMLTTSFYPSLLEAEKENVPSGASWWIPYTNTLEAGVHPNQSYAVSISDYNQPISRQDATTFIEHIFLNQGVTFPNSDEKKVIRTQYSDLDGSLSSERVVNAIYFGIVGGKTSTTFDLEGLLTRAEAAVIVKNLVDSPYLTEGDSTSTVGTYLGTTENKTVTVQNSYSNEQDQQVIFSHGSSFTLIDGMGTEVEITSYDLSGKTLSTKTISKELPLFGGFYQGETYYYGVYGQDNSELDNAKEVVRVVKYDQNFNRISSLSLTGADTTTAIPFRAGNCRMAEENGVLVVHTTRQRYNGHQSQLTFMVDTHYMEVKNVITQYPSNHVSHSFDQYVLFDEGRHILLDHGDAYPREIVIHKHESASIYTDQTVLEISGETGYNYTGISLGGFAASTSHYLIGMNQVASNQTSYIRDPYLLLQSKTGGTSQKISLSSCISAGKTASAPYLIDLNSNHYLLIWEERSQSNSSDSAVYWQIVNGTGGTVVGKTLYDGAYLSYQQTPVLVGNQVIWTTDNNTRTLYQISIPSNYVGTTTTTPSTGTTTTTPSTGTTTTPSTGTTTTTPSTGTTTTTPSTGTTTTTPSTGTTTTPSTEPIWGAEIVGDQTFTIRFKESDVRESGENWLIDCQIMEIEDVSKDMLWGLKIGDSLTVNYHTLNGNQTYSSASKTIIIQDISFFYSGRQIIFNKSTDNVAFMEVLDTGKCIMSYINGNSNYTYVLGESPTMTIPKTKLTRETLAKAFEDNGSNDPHREFEITIQKGVTYAFRTRTWPI